MTGPIDVTIRPRRHYTPKQRAQIFQREAMNAYLEGRGNGRDPICLHCGLPVIRGVDRFVIAHREEKPHCFGGRSVGIAHPGCNARDNAQNVMPALAKTDRVRERHLGARGSGLGRSPMPGGRRDAVKKTFRHGVQPRVSAHARHARLMASRAILTTLPDPDQPPPEV